MTSSKNTHASSVWTEVEYSARCTNPYISTPIYVPEETSYFICRADGTRQQCRLSFVVFRADGADADDWEDDPMVGRLDICVLGEGDEEVEPVEAVYLGISPDRFLSVVREDDQEIVFDFTWRQGTIEIDRAHETDEGFVVRKDDFGDDGISCRLTPREGNPFTLRLQIPYVGFSLLDADDNKLSGDIEIAHSDIHNYSYAFVGDQANDRFQIALDEGKLNYMCVLNEDNQLSVRDMRNRMELVKEIDLQGPLSDLLMGAHSLLVKNKMAPPFREAEFDIMYGEGISMLGELIDLGVKLDLVQKSGSWYSMGETRIGQGRDSAKQYLRDNPEVAEKLEADIRRDFHKLMSSQSKIAARAAGRAVDVSADDFKDED